MPLEPDIGPCLMRVAGEQQPLANAEARVIACEVRWRLHAVGAGFRLLALGFRQCYRPVRVRDRVWAAFAHVAFRSSNHNLSTLSTRASSCGMSCSHRRSRIAKLALDRMSSAYVS